VTSAAILARLLQICDLSMTRHGIPVDMLISRISHQDSEQHLPQYRPFCLRLEVNNHPLSKERRLGTRIHHSES
jgi:hypothetical protein